jgi:hypothetical protein
MSLRLKVHCLEAIPSFITCQCFITRSNEFPLATAPRFVFNALHILYFMVRKIMSCLNIFDLIFSLTVPERASPLV